MSYQDTERFLNHTTLDGKAWQVMSVICHHANLDTGAAWPSQETIATKAKCSTKTVQRAVKAAVDAGELYVIPGNGRGQLTTYIVLVGLSPDEQRDRLALNKVDTSCPPFDTEKVDILTPKGGHFDATQPLKVDTGTQKVDILTPKGGLSDVLQKEGKKKEERVQEEQVKPTTPQNIIQYQPITPPKGSSDGYTYTPDPLTHPANHDPQPMVAKRIMPISTLSPLEQGWEMAKQTVQMSVNTATYDFLVDPLVIVDYIEGVIRIRCFPHVQARVAEGFARALFRACKRQPMFAKAHSVLIEAQGMDAVMVTPEVQLSAAVLPGKGRIVEVTR